ncbi:hypothetical protein TSMEX_007921 [Taenia solium]|eukprot:TsM_000642600 transcript=TsM_000642600 gene=TsM_000642600
MDSLVWEDASFTNKNSERFRKNDILHSFLWAVFNLIAALWLSVFFNPGPIFLHYPRVSLRFIIFQIITVLLLCLFFVSAARHLYYLCIALKLFESKGRKAEVKSPSNDLVCGGRFGPTIFSKSVPALPSFGSCFSSPNLSINRETNQMLAERSRASWCPDKFSSLVCPFGDASPPNISVSPNQNIASASARATPAISFNLSIRSNQSWTSPLATATPRRTSLTRWGTYSSTSPSTMTVPLQYQLSPSLSSGSCLDIGNNFVKSINSTPSDCKDGDVGSNPFSFNETNGDGGFERLMCRGRKAVTAPEKSASEYWKTNNVTELDLDRWTVDIRRWLHGTILRRVVDEIASANAKILKLSDDAALIGSTTLNTLEQLAKGRYQHIVTLPTLIRFLELTKEQNYLVFRLQELARGSCLGEFRWDAGSRSTVSPWKDYLPNDTMILLHIFSTYMDSLLPPHAKCLTGGVFGQLHLVRSPDKPGKTLRIPPLAYILGPNSRLFLDLKSKYNAQIYVATVQPPSIKIVIDGIIYTFPPVRFPSFLPFPLIVGCWVLGSTQLVPRASSLFPLL